jgi:hypothetical protein
MFIYLLVESGRLLRVDDRDWTVANQRQAIQIFDAWVSARYLTRKGGESTKDRLAKNWYGLVHSVNQEGLFHSFPEPGVGEKLYGIRLPPHRLVSDLPELPRVLRPRA